MLTIKAREAGNQNFYLGFLYNADKGIVDGAIVQKPEYDSADCSDYTMTLKSVFDIKDRQEILDVSPSAYLKSVAGFLDLGSAGKLLKGCGETEKYHEILVRAITFKHFCTIKTEGFPKRNKHSGSHYVKTIKYGGEIFARILVGMDKKSPREHEKLSGKAQIRGIIGSGADDEFKKLRELAGNNKFVYVTTFSNPEVDEKPTGIDSLESFIKRFPKLLPGVGVPLQYELEPLENVGLIASVEYKINDFAKSRAEVLERQYHDLVQALKRFQTIEKSGNLKKDPVTKKKCRELKRSMTGTKDKFVWAIGEIDHCLNLQCPHEDNQLEACIALYQKETNNSTFSEVLSEFEENHVAEVFEPKDYPALSLKKIKELSNIPKFTKDQMKQVDSDSRVDIDDKLERAQNKDIIDRLPLTGKKELRVVLVGKTGSGKSATANLLTTDIGEGKMFDESVDIDSATQEVNTVTVTYGSRIIHVMDTPGFLDTRRNETEIRIELIKGFQTFIEGFDAVMIVRNFGNPRFDESEQKAILEVEKVFKSNVWDYCFLVYTHGDSVLKDEEFTLDTHLEQVKKSDGLLKNIVIEKIQGRLMFVDNTADTKYERSKYKNQLIKMVDLIQDSQQRKPYFDRNFQAVAQLNKDLSKEMENPKLRLYQKGELLLENLYQLKLAACVSNQKRLSLLDFIKGKEEYKNLEPVYRKCDLVKMLMEEDRELGKGIHSKLQINSIDDEIAQVKNAIYTAMGGHVRKLFTENKVDQSMIKVMQRIHHHGDHRYEEKLKILATEEWKESESTKLLRGFLTRVSKELHKVMYGGVLRKVKNHGATKIKALYDEMKEWEDDKPKKLQNPDSEKILNDVIKNVRKALPMDVNEVLTEEDLVCTLKANLEDIKKMYERYASAICFPGTSKVLCQNGETKAMKELVVGDMVLTVDSKERTDFEPIILFSHGDARAKSPFICLDTTDGRRIKLSPGHLIPVNTHLNLQRADDVQVGDLLGIVKGSSLYWTQVQSTCIEIDEGLFCPHTESGTIVVDGVLASCYTDAVSVKLTHLLLWPVKMLYKFLPSNWFMRISAYTKQDGMPALLMPMRWAYFKFTGQA